MEDCENGKMRIEDSCDGEDLRTMLDITQFGKYNFEAGVGWLAVCCLTAKHGTMLPRQSWNS